MINDPIMAEPIIHPGLGCAVLACACGTVLDAADMYRILHPGADSPTAIYRIGCRPCAREAVREIQFKKRYVDEVAPRWERGR